MRFLRDPVWLLLAGVAVIGYAVPILLRLHQLKRSLRLTDSVLLESNVVVLCCVVIAFVYSGIMGGAAMAVLWGGLTWVGPQVVRRLRKSRRYHG